MAKKVSKKVKTVVKKQKNGDVVIIKKNSEVGYKKPPKHTQFKKGVAPNPTGINQSKVKRAINEFNRSEISRAINIVMTSTEEEVTATLNDPGTTLGFKTILRAMLNAAEEGNYSKFYEIAEHVIGKIPNKVELNNNVSLGQKLEDKEKLKLILKAIENEV